jgi:hypothetical protein
MKQGIMKLGFVSARIPLPMMDSILVAKMEMKWNLQKALLGMAYMCATVVEE